MDEDRVTELYRLPLEQFTAARDRLAGELKAGGDDVAASAVKGLRKPTVAAWAVNQLAHREPEVLSDLLDTIARMRDASSPDELRSLSQRRHALAADLRGRAAAILEETGYGVGSATLHLVSQTLYAGASEENRDLLERGRLTRDLSPTGFETFTGAIVEEEVEEHEPRVSSAARRKAEKLAAEAQALANEAAQLDETADRKEEEARDARRRAETARRRALRAREKSDRALDQL